MDTPRTQVGIAHNGPMTSFFLDQDGDGCGWHLCRDDLANIATGTFTFSDGRPPIDLDDADKQTVMQMAEKILAEIARGEFWADLDGFADEFKYQGREFGALTEADLGRKFFHNGEPHIFLGANPENLTPRDECELVADHLPSGTLIDFSVEDVEKAFGKTTDKCWKEGF